MLIVSASAESYYVDPTGNDAANGLTPATAWKTVAKVNATTLKPGDAVLFRRGGAWRECLMIPASGTAQAPITVAAYGDGTKPRFIGNDLIPNTTFRDAGAGTYATDVVMPVNAVLRATTFLFDPQGKPLNEVEESYAWSNGILTVHTAKDPRANKEPWSVCVREDLIQSNGKDNLIIRDLMVEDSAKSGGGYGVRIMGSHNVLVERVEVLRAGKHHFGCINSTGIIHRSCYAAYAMPRQGNGGASAFVSYGDRESGLVDQISEYHECLFEHAEDTWNSVSGGEDRYFIFLTHGAAISSVLLKNMISRGGGWSVSNGEAPTAKVRIEGGLLTDNRLTVDGTGIVIDGLRLTGTQATIDLMGKDHVVQNLVMQGTNLGSAWFQTAILARGPGMILRFSTIVMADDAPDYNSCLVLAESAAGFQCYGNVLWSNGKAIRVWNGAYERFATCDFNAFRPEVRFGDEDLGTWRKHDRDMHSLTAADLRFTNAKGGDFTLQKTSPLLDRVEVPEAPATDAMGTRRPQGKRLDLGAFELPVKTAKR
ncbi:MAG TPA: choice-of-anchor Q domain-containing protein [Planctomycetota bacterium]|nr:choice-of-anchor Q domain-containing protein [Planctomycetota bacterium]